MFAKLWQSGQVKTRLARDIGPAAAAATYRAFVQTLVARFAGITSRQLLCYSPPTAAEAFARMPLGDWELAPQASGDLGQRMQHYFQAALDGGYERTLLIGSDSPDLPVKYVAEALEALQTHGVVLGPTEDGGYCLVGCRVGAARAVPPIFGGIAWSTPDVLSQTLARLAAAGLTPHLLPPWYDVDEVADLRRLIATLKQRADGAGPLADLHCQLHDILRDRPDLFDV
jgi:rSAM/selenodomain-associated transferase 1